MNKNSRLKVLAGVLIALVIVAIVVIKNYMNPPRPAPNQTGYYTGPMINKARTLIVDDNGKVYGPAPAEGTTPAQPGGKPAEAGADNHKP